MTDVDTKAESVDARERSTRLYIGTLAVLALSMAASWLYWYGVPTGYEYLIGSVFSAALICTIQLIPIRVSEHSEIVAVDIGFVISVVVLGPTWTSLAAVVYAVLVGRRDLLRTFYEIVRTLIEIHVAAILFALVSGPLMVNYPRDFSFALVGATCIAAMAFFLTNCCTDAGLLCVKYGQTAKQTWKEQVEPYLFSDLINVATAGLCIAALLIYGPLASVFVFSGAIVSQVVAYRTRFHMLENRRLKERIDSLEESLNVANLTFGAMVIEDIGSKDGYTHHHAAATSVYAADIAREMQLDEKTVERLRTAGLLHNIGMFGAPVDLLVATGTPNSIAKGLIAEHPVLGERALSSVPEFSEMASWVRWHHERPDGRGYPDRLRGPWIPLEAKILAVAQAYAATVLDQPRRPGMPYAEARQELNGGAGTQFDEVVVRALLRILDTESEGYRMADDHRFIFRAMGAAEPKLKFPADADENSRDGV